MRVRAGLVGLLCLGLRPALFAQPVPRRAPVPLDTLIIWLRDPDRHVRSSAAQTIGGRAYLTSRASAAAALQPLIEVAARDSDQAVRTDAVFALSQLGDLACSAVPLLLSIRASPDERMRQAVAEAFGEIGLTCLSEESAAAVLEALKRAARDPRASVRYQAVSALGRLGPAAGPGLAAALGGADSRVAGEAAALLGQLPPTPATVNALIRALRAASENVRLEAAYALGGFGPPVRKQLDHLAADRSPLVRSAVRRGVRFYARAAQSPVAGRCFAVTLGSWTPVAELGADSVFLQAPPLVRFSTVRYDPAFITDSLAKYRVEPVTATPRFARRIGFWAPHRDSVEVGWGGFPAGGFRGMLPTTGDTLLGTVVSEWDFIEPIQSAPIRLAREPCS